jgi:hypothetical protein
VVKVVAAIMVLAQSSREWSAAAMMGRRGSRDNKGQQKFRVGKREWRVKAEEREKVVKSRR